jgi:hypothetical protein
LLLLRARGGLHLLMLGVDMLLQTALTPRPLRWGSKAPVRGRPTVRCIADDLDLCAPAAWQMLNPKKSSTATLPCLQGKEGMLVCVNSLTRARNSLRHTVLYSTAAARVSEIVALLPQQLHLSKSWELDQTSYQVLGISTLAHSPMQFALPLHVCKHNLQPMNCLLPQISHSRSHMKETGFSTLLLTCTLWIGVPTGADLAGAELG